MHIQKIKGYSSFCIIKKKKKENSNGKQISPIRLAKVRKVESTLSVVPWLRDRKQITLMKCRLGPLFREHVDHALCPVTYFQESALQIY